MMRRLFLAAAILLASLAWLPVGAPALAQEMDDGSQDCAACHRLPNMHGIEGQRVNIALCQECHGDPQVDRDVEASRSSLYVDPAEYQNTLHGEIACVACHTDVARNPHQADETVACPDCHATILVHVHMGAPHISTDCAACHLTELSVVQDETTSRVVLADVHANGAPLDRTKHDMVKDTGCDKCHVSGNDVGAPAVVLPARSILCMPCHDASPTVGIALFGATGVVTDYGSIIGLLVFGVGIVLSCSLYLSGEIPGHPDLTAMQKLSYLASGLAGLVFSRRVFRFAGGLVADGILLRRVLQESVGRWVVHALIYLPFLARFVLGLITWLGQAFWPSAAWTQTLSNKDAPGVAFAYDLMTCLMFLGVLLALFRRFVIRDRRLLTFAQDKIAIFLLGAILLIGIITEGIRLLNAGTPQEMAVYSFLGYAVAVVLRPLNSTWTWVYPAIWYLHAWLVVAFIAYLPFSKFMHILVSPLIASLDAVRKGSP